MNYFFLNHKNEWEQVQDCEMLQNLQNTRRVKLNELQQVYDCKNLENLQNTRQVKLYDYCEKTNRMVFVGIGLY